MSGTWVGLLSSLGRRELIWYVTYSEPIDNYFFFSGEDVVWPRENVVFN